FQRTPLNKENTQAKNKYEENRRTSRDYNNDNSVYFFTKSYSHAVKGGRQSVNEEMASTPAMVLEEDCLNLQDYTNSLMGRVNEFFSLSNLKKVLANEGFANTKIAYLGELWVLLKFKAEESKIRANEVLGWVPDILEVNEEEEESNGESQERDLKGENEVFKSCSIFREDDDVEEANGDRSHTFSKKGPNEAITYSISSGQFRRLEIPRTGGSILHLMDELVKVGQIMGYNMDGCSKNIEEIIQHQLVNEGFDKFVEDTWREASVQEYNAIKSLMKRLKFLKQRIRDWHKEKKKSNHTSKSSLKQDLAKLDKVIDSGEDDIWMDEPLMVKQEFLNHFKSRFDKPNETRINLNMHIPNIITSDQCDDLEIKIIESDVVAAVCFLFHHGLLPKGSNLSFIALIPKTSDANMVKNYRPISLIGSLCKIITKVLANRLVNVLGNLVNEVQSAFVANRKILYGPFILNELFQWYDILKNFGFGDRWCGWIRSCLNSSRGSIIVNGSPTEEFQFYKRLKQGLFNGIVLGPTLQLSHMFYADDAIFVGQWSNANIDTLVLVLECFHRASGKRINMNKSKIMGISVEEDKVDIAASKIGCLILKSPFSYLGSKVGGLMSHIQSWNEVVDRVYTHLSKWKMKTLSIEGRLTLLKSALGSMPIYHMSIFKVLVRDLQRLESIRSHLFNGNDLHGKVMSWVKWKNVLASKEKGDLGVSRLYALNREKLISMADKLEQVDLGSSLRRMPRDGVELMQFSELNTSLEGLQLLSMNDRWTWTMVGTGDFYVASARKYIDDKKLQGPSITTRWVKAVSIKINIMAWKVRFDYLLTRLNLSRRGLELQSILCPICNKEVA
nr:RNA-directed DNA polymerase, eukaryota [Tanacetum cinerariifolium]